jgi:hypothetical protein
VFEVRVYGWVMAQASQSSVSSTAAFKQSLAVVPHCASRFRLAKLLAKSPRCHVLKWGATSMDDARRSLCTHFAGLTARTTHAAMFPTRALGARSVWKGELMSLLRDDFHERY